MFFIRPFIIRDNYVKWQEHRDITIIKLRYYTKLCDLQKFAKVYTNHPNFAPSVTQHSSHQNALREEIRCCTRAKVPYKWRILYRGVENETCIHETVLQLYCICRSIL